MFTKCKRCGIKAYIPDNIRVNPIMAGLCLECIGEMIEKGRDERARI